MQYPKYNNHLCKIFIWNDHTLLDPPNDMTTLVKILNMKESLVKDWQ